MAKDTKLPPSLGFLKGTTGAPIVCPKCRAADFDARMNQFEILRTCRACNNVWSGGSMGAALIEEPHVDIKPFVPPNTTPPSAENDPDLDIPDPDAHFRR